MALDLSQRKAIAASWALADDGHIEWILAWHFAKKRGQTGGPDEPLPGDITRARDLLRASAAAFLAESERRRFPAYVLDEHGLHQVEKGS
jgi:hypothetical protein